MELIENLLQLLTTFIGALLSGIAYRKSQRQAYFLLLCFYGCFALGALYWTLYLLLFDTTPRVFYVSEFGWVASLIFLRILQATLSTPEERAFRCRRAWLAPAFGVPLLAFYCTSACCALPVRNISSGRWVASGRIPHRQVPPSGVICC